MRLADSDSGRAESQRFPVPVTGDIRRGPAGAGHPANSWTGPLSESRPSRTSCWPPQIPATQYPHNLHNLHIFRVFTIFCILYVYFEFLVLFYTFFIFCIYT